MKLDPIALSQAQQMVWLGQVVAGEKPLYNLVVSYRIQGELDHARFSRACDSLVSSSDILQSRVFQTSCSTVFQQRDTSVTAACQIVDVADEAEAQAWIEERSGASIDPCVKMFDCALLCLPGNQLIFYWAQHHISTDGSNIELIIRYLEQCYLDIEPLNIPEYFSFAAQESTELNSPRHAQRVEYWQNKSARSLSIPEFYANPFDTTYKTNRLRLELDEQLNKQLRAVAETKAFKSFSQDMSFFAVFATALIATVSRITVPSEEDDNKVRIGFPSHARNSSAKREMLGMFVSMGFLEVDLEADDTFETLARKILNDAARSLVSLSSSVQSNEIYNSFSTSVNMIRAQAGEFAGHPMDIEWHSCGYSTSGTQLDLHITDFAGSGNFALLLDLAETVFGSEEQAWIKSHLQLTLEALAEDASQTVADYPLADWSSHTGGKNCILSHLDTRKEFAAADTVIAQFEAVAAHNPVAQAARCNGVAISYQILNSRANQIARWIHEHNQEGSSVVMVCMYRSVDMLAVFLGALKAGCAYVPVDPAWPAERRRQICKDTQADVVFSSSGLVDANEHEQVVELESMQLEHYSSENLSVAVAPEKLAYIMYTSGSTGTPKGVMVSHAGLRNYICWVADEFHQNAAVDYPFYSSVAFDLSIHCLYVPLITGGSVVVYEDNAKATGLEIQDVVLDDDIDVLFCTPSHMQVAIDTLRREGVASKRISCILLGGEELRSELARRVLDVFNTDTKIINIYGPTEGVVGCLAHFFDESKDQGISVPIGSPAANTRIYIVDRNLKIVPQGVVGELCIARDPLSKGYLNASQLTKEKFIVNPFEPGALLYRSGDLARWDGHGNVQYVGRGDSQIKYNGIRVELAEVENALETFNGVTSAVAKIVKLGESHKQLVAYYTSPAPISARAMRSFLYGILPLGITPGRYIWLEAMPVTRHGKIDRAALPVVQRAESGYPETYVHPVNQAEKQLIDIWEEVFQIEKIGIKNNFHELGGNSLMALKIASLCSHEGYDVSVQQIYESANISELAEFLSDASATSRSKMGLVSQENQVVQRAQQPAPGLVSDADLNLIREQVQQREEFKGESNIKDVYALTNAQTGILFHSLRHQRDSIYSVQLRIDIEGPLDVDTLKDAWIQLVERHDALRTVFFYKNIARPAQVVLHESDFHFTVHDLAGMVVSDRENWIVRVARESFTQPFRLDEGPLLRVTILKESERDHHMICDSHHIALDGLSTQRLFEELQLIYQSKLDDQEPRLAVALGMKPYIQDHVLNPVSGAPEFWREKLAGFELPTSPLINRKSNSVVHANRTSVYSLDTDCSEAVRQLAGSCRVTENIVYEAAWALLLSHYGNTSDVLFGYTVNGRSGNFDRDSQAVGMFVNTLPMRVRGVVESSLLTLLHKIQHEQNTHTAYEASSLAEIQNSSEVPISVGLFDSLLVFQPFSTLTEAAADSITFSRPIVQENTHMPLTLEIYPSAETEVQLIFNDQVVSEAEVQKIVGHYFRLLQAMRPSNRDVQLRSLTLLDNDEQQSIIALGAGDKTEKWPSATVHAQFKIQAKMTPNKVALREGKDEISFEELDGQSDTLARFLVSEGIGRGDTVGVFFKRSTRMLTAMLAVMKVGARYIPLDPTYPSERLAYMLENSAASLLLSDRHAVSAIRNPTLPCFLLDSDWDAISQQSKRAEDWNADIAVQSTDMYIMYTSGSTGLPKGIVGTHQATMNRFAWMWRNYPFTGSDICCQKTSIGFVDSVWELFGPLLQGVTTVVIPDDDVLDIFRFVGILETQKISRLVIVPTLLSVLLDVDNIDSGVLNNLKICIVSGEPLPQQLALRFLEILPHCQLLNLYGSTEITADVTVDEVSADSLNIKMPIGRAIDNVQMYILDRNLQILPQGAVGEIAVAGAGLSAGYHAQKELNLEKFVVNPYRSGDLFLTGDLGRFRSDGRIEHHGRRDSQVKIRGQRIETAEIENVLLDAPGVSKALVSVVGLDRLVAYYVLSDAAANDKSMADERQLRDYAQKRLAPYMVPQQWELIQDIPLLPNGKVDRISLRKMLNTVAIDDTEFEEPTSLNEVKLAGVWCEVLELDRVSLNQDFFDLGGNSITAMQIMVGASRVGLNLTLDQILSNSTLGKLGEIATDLVGSDSYIALHSQSEILAQLNLFNQTQTSYDESLSPTDLIWQQAAKTPHRTAVCYENSTLSYAQLTEQADRFADYLAADGVKPADVIGVCLDRSVEMLVAILAVMRVGAAYCPLDPTYPESRIRFFLDDVKTVLLVTHSTVEVTQSLQDIRMLCIDTDRHLIDAAPVREEPEQFASSSIAYIIHTSGSTGRPKGVQVTRRNVSNFLLSMKEQPGLEAEDRLLAVTTISFDIAVLELFLPLVCGASVDIASTRVIADSEAMAERISEMDITVMQATPTRWRLLLANGWTGKSNFSALIGGEALPQELVQSLLPKIDSIWNMYGPTETTVWSTCAKIEDANSTITIGKPIANTQVYVLDAEQQLCDINVPGELYIAGDGVSVGYFERPELNASAFIENTLQPELSKMLYRTGDVAKWLPDGRLQCFGRMDSQVQINGVRVELGEIESVLAKHAQIEQAVVHVHRINDSEQLVAYIVAGDNKKDELQDRASESDIKRHLASLLPDYMVPSLITFISEVPLTNNGKVDKKALPVPVLTNGKGSDPIDDTSLPENQPSTKLQSLVHSVWCFVLQREAISINSDFFGLGGNSINAMQIMVSIKKAGYLTSLKQVMEQASIAKLAEVVTEIEDNAQNASSSDFSTSLDGVDNITTINTMLAVHPSIAGQDNVVDMFPLTSQQRGILFHILLSGVDEPLYIAQVRCDFIGPLDLDCYTSAWEKLVVRHDALRSVILHEALHDPLQVILKEGKLAYHQLDISHIAEQDQEQELDRIANESLNTAISIEKAPVLRVYTIKTAPEAHHVIVAFHHLLLDGWSVSILSGELGMLYTAELDGKSTELPQPGSFRDHVLAVNNLNEQEITDFWNSKLAGLTAPTPIVTRPENNQGQHATGGKQTVLDSYTTEKLNEFARSCRVTPNILVQSAWAMLLSLYNNTDDVMFGFAVTGRSSGISNFETTVGMFINSLPMRIKIDQSQCVGDWFKSIQLLQASMVEFEHSALGGIKAASSLPLGTELFDSQLVFQNFPASVLEEESKIQVLNMRGHENSHLPFMLQVFPGNEMLFNAMYIEELFDEGDVDNILSSFFGILRSITALDSPKSLVSDISMLSNDDIEELVSEFNQTQMDYLEESAPSDLIWLQAQATPDRIAVSYEDSRLSYYELTDRADQLANYLIEKGAKADVLIGVCLHRGIDLLVALLAIQRSGAAYLPLDPEYPQSRIDYILDNADVPLLVTSSDIESVEGSHNAALVCMDTDNEAIHAALDVLGSVVCGPENLCYVIYTSGSTGLPKGVQLTRRNVTNFLCAMKQCPGISPDDNVLAVTTVAFDIAVLELYLPLLVGGRVDIASRELSFDGYAMRDRIAKENITMMQATPTTWRLLLAAEWQSAGPFKALVGGEALPRDLSALLVPVVGELWNMYGPTETTVWSTCERITDADEAITIGRPIGNTQIYILDNKDGLCSVNMPGELCIGGDGVSAGYLKRDDLTSEKFVVNPVIKTDQGLVYRTGDVAKWLPDGRLECLGRKDSQIKLRGFRIELGEIETVLSKRDGISQAVVSLHKENELEMLVAYIVEAAPNRASGEIDGVLNEGDLREYMRGHLPHYMIPGAFVALESMPLTPNGKIDRKALPAPDAGAGSVATSAHDDPTLPENQPKGDVQQTLHEIWAKAMHRETISIHTHFFDMGGNSITAMQIMATAKQHGLGINLLDIFELGTISLLAEAADTSEFANTGSKEQGHEPIPLRPIEVQHQGDDMDRISEMLRNQKEA